MGWNRIKCAVTRYLTGAFLRRNKSLSDRVSVKALGAIRPRSITSRRKTCQELLSKTRVAVVSPSDKEDNLYRRLQWGDYWAQYELTKALGEEGYLVTSPEREPDVVIHLFGAPSDLPGDAYKVLWVYSHPEQVTSTVLSRYDRVFCLSRSFCEEISSMGFPAEWLPGASSWSPLSMPTLHDVVFVGNARDKDAERVALMKQLIGHHWDVKVWGNWWERYVPSANIGGPYYDYPRLGELYGSSAISLSIHLPAMREWGFVAFRVFDILASGGFCVSDRNAGLQEVFGSTVPTFESVGDAVEITRHYMEHPEERNLSMREGRKIAKQHTWRARARALMGGISPWYEEFAYGRRFNP